MPLYIASYDYHNERDYSDLYDLLGRLGAVRILLSTWPVSVAAGAPALRNAMQDCGDGDESFAVIELVPGSDWATFAVPSVAVDWLSDNVTPKA